MPLDAAYIARPRISTKRGRSFELAAIHKQTWTNAAAIDDNGFLTTTAGPNATTITPTLAGALCTGGVGLPDYPRNVIVTVTHATSIVACNGIVSGTDIYGRSVTNTWSVTATGTSKTSATAQTFKRVTSVTITAAGDASANSVIVGTGDVLGLDMLCIYPARIAELEDGSVPTAGTVVIGSSSANTDRFGSYDPNSALNGALDFDLWYLVDADFDVDYGRVA